MGVLVSEFGVTGGLAKAGGSEPVQLGRERLVSNRLSELRLRARGTRSLHHRNERRLRIGGSVLWIH